jgi:ketosteroid isomerase-like protein
MSEENVELMRRVFDAASRRADPTGRAVDALDHDSMAVVYKSMAPEVEVHEDPRFPEAGIYQGVEAVRGYFERFAESFDEFSFEAEEFIGLADDRVLVLFRLTTRGKGSGARVEARPGWIYTIRDDLTVRIDAFLNRDEALEAAGLSE